MKIILKKIGMSNFAGSETLEIDFFEDLTQIEADNGVGKTRFIKAFMWLISDKNEEDRKDFNIKNTKNLEKNRQDHEAWSVLNVDGSDIVLKKIYREKHQKKHGSKLTEFTGNETLYYFDGVPLQKTEYKAKLDKLVNEELFKLLTNPFYFNKLNWTKQREIITQLAPNVSDADVAAESDQFKVLINSLTNGKTMKEYKSEISNKKTAVKKELEQIPPRIDELQRSIPVEEDYESLTSQLTGLMSEVEKIDKGISDEAEKQSELAKKQLLQQQEISKLKLEKQEIESNIRMSLSKKSNAISEKKTICRGNISKTELEISSLRDQGKRLVEMIQHNETELTKLREKFKNINASEFIPAENKSCVTCGQTLPENQFEENIKKQKETHIKDKYEQLEKINETGLPMKDDIQKWGNQLLEINNKVDELEIELAGYKSEFLSLNNSSAPEMTRSIDDIILEDPGYQNIVLKIGSAEAELLELKPIDKHELQTKKAELTLEVDALKIRISKRDDINKINLRIKQLEESEGEFAQQLADLENIEFNIFEFEKAKIEKIEGTVNSKFKHVKFKLFDTQVNGQEVPTCQALVDGVPFADANTAGKINAGLDIIQTLSNHFSVSAPIFIDNKESVTNLNAINCQVITLSVLKGQKTLKVS